MTYVREFYTIAKIKNKQKQIAIQENKHKRAHNLYQCQLHEWFKIFMNVFFAIAL